MSNQSDKLKRRYNKALEDVENLIKEIFYLKGADFPIVNVDMILEFEKKIEGMKNALTESLNKKEN